METKTFLLTLRKKHGLSQEQMANKLFVTRQAVSRWENGETLPGIDTLKSISKIFDVSPGSLLGFEADKLCLFNQDDFTFSYRAAGILVKDNKVLLQKPRSDGDYAFPGGHVLFGETTASALIRRWREETGMDIIVGELKWVEENLFFWNKKPCHQICLNYIVNLKKEKCDSLADGFTALTYSENDKNALHFYWIPLDEVQNIKVYPENAAELLSQLNEPLKHITYFEDIIK